LVGGCLFAGPCGITTLQLRDFVTTTVIRTVVSGAASAVEAAIIEVQQEAGTGGP
jgi:hypothetical protein